MVPPPLSEVVLCLTTSLNFSSVGRYAAFT
jgi:hypothetical protein